MGLVGMEARNRGCYFVGQERKFVGVEMGWKMKVTVIKRLKPQVGKSDDAGQGRHCT